MQLLPFFKRRLGLFKSKKINKNIYLSVSHAHFDKSSPIIIIYNNCKRSFRNLNILVKNDNDELFGYQLQNLSYRSAVEIDTSKPDINSKTLTGNISAVEIQSNNETI